MNEFKLKLDSFGGFVLLDPYNFDDFCIENKIIEKNVMDFFIKNENIGDNAVKNGKILAIYTIKPVEYTIMISDKILVKEGIKFIYKNFLLEITNGKLLVSDIYAIINWEPNFYKNLKNDFPSQYIMDYKNGNYSVDIIGYYQNRNNCGYNFILNNREKLPEIDKDKDINTYNFNIL
jgi:hypothetical protein